MFSIMDFLPTFAHIVNGKMPTDRAIDGVNQIDVLLGSTVIGRRESLLSFIGADLVAARWKQWRIYFTDVHPTGIGPQRQPGMFSATMAGYPKIFNIEEYGVGVGTIWRALQNESTARAESWRAYS
jgi:hypothetical protein